MSDLYSTEVESLLGTWYQRLRIARTIHYESAKPLSKANWFLGLPVAILSAIVGTSVFASLETTVDIRYKILVGLISILAAILASIQTFLRFEERAEKHRSVASHCSALLREIEEVLAFSSKNHEISEEIVKSIRMRYDEISENSPGVSSKMYDKAKRIVKDQDKLEKKNPSEV